MPNPNELEKEHSDSMTKIRACALFATPSSMTSIEDWILLHSTEEQVHLFTVLGMHINFLASRGALIPVQPE